MGYNKVFGYYIEVSHANAEAVPSDYIRKQTLVGAERYVTPELKEYENLILNAQERLVELERAAFGEGAARSIGVRAQAGSRIRSVVAGAAGCFSALAEMAGVTAYVRPHRLRRGASRYAKVAIPL